MNYLFESQRLIFRTWKPDDRLIFQNMNADPAVMEFFLNPLTAFESDRLVDRIMIEINELGYGLWAVEKKDDHQFIGFIGLHRVDFESPFTPCIEIGWRLKKQAWGQGLATEGARSCLAYGFETLNFEQIYSFTSETNLRSISVMKKIGLKKLSQFDHPGLPANHALQRHVLYGITIAEYKDLTSNS